MEKMIIVSIRLPATNSSYEVRIPAGMNTGVAVKLCAQALEGMSEGLWHASKASILAWEDSGRQLDLHNTMDQNKVINGSRLLLI